MGARTGTIHAGRGYLPIGRTLGNDGLGILQILHLKFLQPINIHAAGGILPHIEGSFQCPLRQQIVYALVEDLEEACPGGGLTDDIVGISTCRTRSTGGTLGLGEGNASEQGLEGTLDQTGILTAAAAGPSKHRKALPAASLAVGYYRSIVTVILFNERVRVQNRGGNREWKKRVSEH